MSTARKEAIIKKGFIKSLLDGTLELKDLAGINVNLDMARQAYLQGVLETTQELIELVEASMATADKQDILESIMEIIKVPKTSAGELWGVDATPVGGGEVVLDTLNEAGICDYIFFMTMAQADSHDVEVRVYADELFAFRLVFSSMSDAGFTASTPGCSLTAYAVDGVCACVITRQIDFQGKLELAVYHPTQDITVMVLAYANILV